LFTFWYLGWAISGSALALSLIYWRLHRRSSLASRSNQKTAALRPAILTSWPAHITVGVLTPLPNEASQDLCDGIKELLTASPRTLYNVLSLAGDNNRVTLFDRAQEAARSCDFLVTFGLHCANIASEAAVALKKMPVIKAGLRVEQLTRLVPHSAETVVMVTDYDYQQQVEILKRLKPQSRSICILYRLHTEQVKHEVAAIENCFKANDYHTCTHHLIHNAHIDNQLGVLHSSYDIILLMPYTVTAQNAQELIAYCSSKNITLCSQDFDTVTLGATLGFGKHEKALGAEIAHMIRNTIEGHRAYPPSLVHKPQYQCLINKKNLAAQSIDLSPESLTVLEQITLFDPQIPQPPKHPHLPPNP